MNITIQWMQRIGILFFLVAALAACGGTSPDTSPTLVAAPTAAPAATNAPALPSVPAQRTVAPASPANVVTATPESAAPGAATGQSNSDADPTVVSLPAFNKLNLNTASGDDYLQAIPGFGSRMVREFLEYRPYVSIQQFRKEIGKYVDAATVAGYEKYVFVPIKVNESDAATLQQIPGVTEEIAAQLIAARPFADNDAFLATLSMQLAPNDVTIAQSYLAPQ